MLEQINQVWPVDCQNMAFSKIPRYLMCLTIMVVRLMFTDNSHGTVICFILKAQLWRHSLFLYVIS